MGCIQMLVTPLRVIPYKIALPSGVQRSGEENPLTSGKTFMGEPPFAGMIEIRGGEFGPSK